MKEFIWMEELNTDNEFIDLQHKKIFNYLNILRAARGPTKNNNKLVNSTLDNLIEYTVIHFEEEEIILKRNGYPDLERHHKLHTHFANQVLALKKRIELEEDLLQELIEVVQNWLIIHIKHEDIKALKFQQDE